MRNHYLVYSTIFTALFSFSYADNVKSDNKQEALVESHSQDIEKISESFGHLIGKNLTSLGFNFDMQAVVQGLKDSSLGKSAPMTEVECIQAITSIQEAAYKEQSAINLAKAEDFLKKNRKVKHVVTLEKGKVQFKVEKQGSGEILQPNLSPIIRYVGKFLDGSVFGQSMEDEPISLDEMIPGLKEGMAGMKEGEKRTIYIHPDLAYGTRGSLPPNSLLTFEIELVKADHKPKDENMEGALPQDKTDSSQELALPVTLEETIR